MSFRSIIQKLAYWSIPGGIYNSVVNLGSQTRKGKGENSDHLLRVIQSNSALKDIHKGKRCFILCNGPSINTQDLRLLKNEIVFSVSNGFRHPDYLSFQPAYHCIPQVDYTEKFTKKVLLDWLTEMDKSIGTAAFFLSTKQYDMVKKNGLFEKRQVYYTYFEPVEMKNSSSIYDISNKIPGVQSVPVMCLMIAMYMGFKNIYLLGTEHDSLITRKYKYFYDGSKTVLSNKIESVADDGEVLCSYSDELVAASDLWKQYHRLNSLAKENGMQILNATAGGVLDVFPRVKFETLFN